MFASCRPSSTLHVRATSPIFNHVRQTPQVGLFYKKKAFDFENTAILFISDASHAAEDEVTKKGDQLLGYRSAFLLQYSRRRLLEVTNLRQQIQQSWTKDLAVTHTLKN